jgi:peroxiredoxin Q/BCP
MIPARRDTRTSAARPAARGFYPGGERRPSLLLLGALALAAAGCGSAARRAAELEEAAAAESPLRGAPALGFTLLDQAEQPVSLEDFRGRWLVLYFYPRDGTPGCTCQATEFTRLLAAFADLQAAVAGVSPDSPLAHRAFRQRHGIEVPLLSDPGGEAAQRYGAWNTLGFDDPRSGRAVRSTFLIDPDGRVAWHWPEVVPEGHAARVRAKLESLRSSRG